MPAVLHHIGRLALIALATLTVSVGAAVRADDITVFAAASLKDALDDIAPLFTAQGGDRVVLSYAGSSVLARQIELGAPADLFVSANRNWMDYLQERGAIESGSRVDLLSNRLVLVAHGANRPEVDVDALPRLLGRERLAMALVEAVPAGIYGKAALSSLGLWTDLAPQVAQTDNVRAALALVALGEAPYGIVYRTDAMAEPGVSVVATFPENSHPPIRYPVALIAGHREGGEAFLGFLQGQEARTAFERHGFGTAPEPAR